VTAHPVSGPPPPTWPRTAGALLLGYVAAAIALTAVAWGVSAVGLFAWDSVDRHDVAYVHGGPWSIAARIGLAYLILVLCTPIVAMAVEGVTSEEVSRPALFAVLTITGYLPYLPIRLLPVGGLLALILTTAIVQRRVLGVRPRGIPWLRRAAVGGAAAALLVAGSYALMHPLSAQNVTVIEGDSTNRPSFELRNTSLAGVTVVALTQPEIRSARTGFPWENGVPLAGLRLPPRSTVRVTLDIGDGCARRLPDMAVRYRLFGHELQQPLRVRVPWAHCRRA
jgi:hypothetical protein